MMVHEAAHIIALLIFGCKIVEVQLIIGAIGVKYADVTLSKLQKIMSILMGPLSNLILSVIFLYYGCDIYFGINLVLGLYNLLPLIGLDGGSLIQTFLEGIISTKSVERTLIIFTVLAAVTLFFVTLLYVHVNINYTVLLFCIYLLMPIVIKKIVER
jgi:stage IV sporulation protein FB